MTTTLPEGQLDELVDEIFEDEEGEGSGDIVAQTVKVSGTGDAKRKKATVIKKPSGTTDTGGKKKRVLPKTGGGTDTRRSAKHEAGLRNAGRSGSSFSGDLKPGDRDAQGFSPSIQLARVLASRWPKLAIRMRMRRPL